MATRSSHNKNNSAVKRILQEARELASDGSNEYAAAPLEDDIFEWHCTMRGPAGTEFEGGLYHCRVLLPSEYPFRPPSIMLLTPNGRFELNKKICISFTSYHEELWQPAWGVRTALIGLQGFFPAKGEAALGVGAVEFPAVERKRLATLSREWICPECGVPNKELLPDQRDVEADEGSSTSSPATAQEHTHSHSSSVADPASNFPAGMHFVAAQAQEPAVPPAVEVTATVVNHPQSPEFVAPRPQELAPLPSRPFVLDGIIVLLLSVVGYIVAKKVGIVETLG